MNKHHLKGAYSRENIPNKTLIAWSHRQSEDQRAIGVTMNFETARWTLWLTNLILLSNNSNLDSTLIIRQNEIWSPKHNDS